MNGYLFSNKINVLIQTNLICMDTDLRNFKLFFRPSKINILTINIYLLLLRFSIIIFSM